ncbi:unnamed protein product [Paramecium pentaurelia]|uniref:Phosphatidate cytidylyltransferase, mitochondrial n=1 Tax=Paramecium pentaurelia TaxID=43138 RepID=A0A8S1TTE9_9CILI|nr:unnamed protein product [Paramecium pentaurelia]
MQQIPMTLLKQFIQTLPQSDLSFAYGSAVQPQFNYDYTKNKPMIDLIIAVDNVEEWHQQNIQINSAHYSGLSYYLGSRFIQRMNVEIFPIHFSPFVQYQDLKLKYGVVSTKELIKDLESWKWLSIAGRMQKPIVTIQEFENLRYQRACISNLQSAVAIAILMDFKSSMSLQELLYSVISLSYYGDIRFTLGGENQNKVFNILKGNYKNITELYLSNLGDLNNVIKIQKDGEILIDNSLKSLEFLCSLIPGQLLSIVLGEKDNMGTLKMMSQERINDLIKESVKRKNQFSSRRMLFYNLAMISPLLSVKYGIQKLSKRFK